MNVTIVVLQSLIFALGDGTFACISLYVHVYVCVWGQPIIKYVRITNGTNKFSQIDMRLYTRVQKIRKKKFLIFFELDFHYPIVLPDQAHAPVW